MIVRGKAPDYDSLIINGRFLSATATGVQRVAAELTRALVGRDAAIRRQFPHGLKVIAPADAQVPDWLTAPIERGILRGHVWEQLEVPIRRKSGLLLNLCNLAPLACEHSVVMIHDAQTFSFPSSYSRSFASSYRFALPRLGRVARQVLTVSEFSRQQLSAYGVSSHDRTRIVYNGVDHVFRVAPDLSVLTKLGLHGERYFLAPSSPHAHKNTKMLVDAFRDERLATRRLVLFGASWWSSLGSAISVLPPNIIEAGRVDDAELRALMENASAFVFPSFTEGFGLPPLEAMALGCATVTTNRGALPEVCGEATIYADPAKAADWITALARIEDDDSHRLEYQHRGRKHAAAFTWDRSASDLLKCLADVQQ